MLTLYSPAKVNLFFKIISKRQDGYHNIASLYHTISLVDILSFEFSKNDEFVPRNSHLKWSEDNLIIKAVIAFRNKTKLLDPIKISLEKNIPIQAGLGGGSSNAATTLWALNKLFDFPLEINELIQLATTLGADVSFFFSSGQAFCKGIGNIFEDVQFKKDLKFIIAKPSFGMSTPEVFQRVDLNLLQKIDENILKENVINNNFSFFNDLEISAFSINPKLLEIKKELENMGFEKVVMTGSGSSFICFGNANLKTSEKITFFSVFNIQRNKKNWYLF